MTDMAPMSPIRVNTWAGANAPRPTDADARLMEWRVVLPSRGDGERTAVSLRNAGYELLAEDGEWLVPDPWGTSVRLVTG